MRCPITPFLILVYLTLSTSLSADDAGSTAGGSGSTGAIDEFDSLLMLPASPNEPARMVIGDIRGFIRVFEQREDSFEEVWISEYMEGAISNIFVADVDLDESDELVVFTDSGRFHYLDLQTYQTTWSNPPSEYERITCALVVNLDEDEQPELLFCADGQLVIYDSRDQFEEWTSDQTDLDTTDLLVGDVDGDGANEIVLNNGFVYDAKYRDLEWESPEEFGDIMGLLDVDNDGILELIGEFAGRYIKIFDIDLRREKSIELE